MPLLAITAVGPDRPGIVAEFSGALYRFGCNLEESTMTRLRDEFAMLLIARLPRAEDLGALEEELGATATRLGLSTVIRPLPSETAAAPHPETASFVLRVYGGDKPGIVHAVTRHLAERNWNITDLNTRVIGSAADPVYVMLLEIESPNPEAPATLQKELEHLRRELQVEIGLDSLDREAL